MRYKQPWCPKPYAPTILLLPGFKRGFLYGDRGAHLRNTVSELSMQALAMSGESAFDLGMLSPGRFVPLALLPV
jgi:hypothetical protein